MEDKILNINIYKALINFQSEVPVICKSTEGYGYKYASLAEIKKTIQPHMHKNGLGVFEKTTNDGTVVCVITTIIHTSGEYIESTISADAAKNKGNMSLVQAMGSMATYLRRYGMSSLLGLVTDVDADGVVDQAAQAKYEENIISEEAKKMTKLVEDMRVEIDLIVSQISDEEFRISVENYMKKNNSLKTMKATLDRCKSKLDEQVQVLE